MNEGNETLALLRETVARTVPFDGDRIRRVRGQTPDFDRSVWRRMAEQGWFSILIPEEDGGLGLGLEAAATVAEQLGMSCAPEPFVMAGVLVPALLARMTDRQMRNEQLPPLLAGDRIVSFAWQAPNGSLNPVDTEIRATKLSDGISLSGRCRFVTPADPDAFILLARSPEGLLLASVPRELVAAHRVLESGPDGVFTAQLTLSGLRLPRSAILMEGEDVGLVVGDALNCAVIAQSAELCGLMQRAFSMTLDYLRTRHQFGVPIGSFQALQHRCVDLFIQQELARHATAAAIRAAGQGVTGRKLALAASSAKARAAYAATLITTQAIQLHGAIGFTDEYDLGLYVNRTARLAASLGNAAWHRRRYADLSEGA